MAIGNVLKEELVCRATDLQDLKLGSPEYRTAAESLGKIASAYVEVEKAKADAMAQEEETRLKYKQHKSDTFDKIARNSIQAIAVGGGIAVTVWTFVTSLKYEEHGGYTGTATKNAVTRALNFFKK